MMRKNRLRLLTDDQKRKLLSKPIVFGCSTCVRNKGAIDVMLKNPNKKEQPNWQMLWMCEQCVRAKFKRLGQNLVVL